jgi:hypothetical protein
VSGRTEAARERSPRRGRGAGSCCSLLGISEHALPRSIPPSPDRGSVLLRSAHADPASRAHSSSVGPPVTKRERPTLRGA